MTAGRGKGSKGGVRLSGRGVATRVKTAKKRKTSSTLWLKRQLNDPYVAEAARRGYRSRAALKLSMANLPTARPAAAALIGMAVPSAPVTALAEPPT